MPASTAAVSTFLGQLRWQQLVLYPELGNTVLDAGDEQDLSGVGGIFHEDVASQLFQTAGVE